MSAAGILHADLDAFYASVEQRDDPRLRGRPVIVGGGVVLAASYEARARGVRSAMGGGRARRLCPDAVVVTPRWTAYVEASRAVFAILEDSAPDVEALSIDEAFLDVTGLEHVTGTPREIAAGVRTRVRRDVGLPISVGVARTKSLAKMASAESKPDGLLVVEPGEERGFLDPLPVDRLWGVGAVTGARLRERGLGTIGQLAARTEEELMQLLGRAAGRKLHALAHGRDPRRVDPRRRRRSFGAQSALGRGPATHDRIDAALVGLVDRVTRRMRAKGRAGRTVTLRLRFGDYRRATRSRTLPRSTASTAPVLATARELLAGAWPAVEARGLTLVGVALTGLEHAGDAAQLRLDLEGAAGPDLDAALDRVRDRFGPAAVTRARLLGRGPEHGAWLSPEEAER